MFKVGDTVDIKNRKLDYYGKILEIKDSKAIVRLKFVRHPEGRGSGTCESCGWPGFFSVNGGTGEIVCMRTGCGYEYGFTQTEEIVLLDKLVNITEKKEKEAKEKFILEINLDLKNARSKIEEAFQEGLINEEEKVNLLKKI